MKDIGQRIFALSGAIVFFLTSIALTVVVIVTLIQDKNKPKTDPAANARDAQACQSSTDPQETLPAPEAFTATEPATELQSTDLEEGSGATAKNGDCLEMKYYGTLATNGELFDENFTQPSAFAFVLGQGSVIKGWD
ncbi:MAG TPA: FKBP-type peptidyl-prolyl cis-trans isomerase, partial [Candidatus Limnocylindrales bacterium]|nr:FKBP-type peptidyl-prolyl cis-trans isomerase [Candidatus Limnocylindrales bacterium]